MNMDMARGYHLHRHLPATHLETGFPMGSSNHCIRQPGHVRDGDPGFTGATSTGQWEC
jgi:hypothetical protein